MAETMLNDTTRLFGGALGVAVLGTIMNDIYEARINDALASSLSSSPQLLDAVRGSIQGAHLAAQQVQGCPPEEDQPAPVPDPVE